MRLQFFLIPVFSIAAIAACGDAASDTTSVSTPAGDPESAVDGGGGETSAADANDGGNDAPTTTPPFGPSGTVDTSFGTSGIATASIPLALGSAKITKVLVQSDGKILLAGAAANPSAGQGSDLLFVRLTSDGKMDTSFGSNGIAVVDFYGGYDGVTDVVLDGASILAVGTAGTSATHASTTMGIVRLDASGKLDPSFASGGKLDTNRGIGVDGARIALAPGNKIVVASGGDVLRFSSSGAIDPSFGAGAGRVSIAVGPNLSALAVQDDGRILLGTTATFRSLVRFEASGKQDYWTKDAPTIVLFTTSKLIWTLRHDRTSPARIVSRRFFATGEEDFTYGDGDANALEVPAKEFLVGAVLDKQDRLVEVLETDSNTGTKGLAVRRANSDFTGFDPSFGTKGVADLGIVQLAPCSVALAPDGRIVVASATFSVTRIFP